MQSNNSYPQEKTLELWYIAQKSISILKETISSENLMFTETVPSASLYAVMN